jgi:hypothetical protein
MDRATLSRGDIGRLLREEGVDHLSTVFVDRNNMIACDSHDDCPWLQTQENLALATICCETLSGFRFSNSPDSQSKRARALRSLDVRVNVPIGAKPEPL